MKLLVITQIVDAHDSNLGFFHNWLIKIAAQVDHVYIICLKEGKHSLPGNVTILSLGKEKRASRLQYLIRFYTYIFQYRYEYNHVLVHMNPEYVVLGGLLWRAWHKKVLLWYVHKSVNLKLRLAEKLVTKIFTTSIESFRLPSKKVQVVGHGIDIAEFIDQGIKPPANKITLFNVSRITRSKDLKTLVEGVAELKKIIDLPVFLEIAGAPITSDDERYFVELKHLISELGLENSIRFLGGLNRVELAAAFQRNQLFVHTSQTGSMDKVVLEALASGRLAVTSSQAYAGAVQAGLVFVFPEGNALKLAETLAKMYASGILEPENLSYQSGIEYVQNNHNLEHTVGKIIRYLTV